MVLHTIMNEYEVLGEYNSAKYSYQNKNGITFEGLKTDKGFQIQRVISTNPKDYLNPDYTYGKFLL